MAEQVTDQHTPVKEVNNSQQQSPNMDRVPESDKNKLKDAGDARHEKQKHAEEPKSENAGDKNQPDVQNSTSSSLSPNKEAETVNDEDRKDDESSASLPLSPNGGAETDHGEYNKEDEKNPLSPVPTEQQIGKEGCENNQEKESSVVEEASNTYNTDTNTEVENNNGEEEEQALVKCSASLPLSPNGGAETDHGEDNKEDEKNPLSPVPTEQQIGKEGCENNQEKESSVVEEASNTYNTDTNTEVENNNGEEEEQALVKTSASLSLSPNGEAETDHGEDKKKDESDGSGSDIEENETSSQTETPQILDNVETVGPTTQETESLEPPDPVHTKSLGGILGYLSVVMVIAAILGAAAINHFYQPESPSQIENWRPTVQFIKEMDILKTKFPNQRAELWNRSRIHLLRHLQTAHPTEPVSLILTAGVRAEKTLHCLARGFASAFSSALNASVLDIDGASKASQDSDEVKLDIDSKLQGAFEGNTPVAIIHRFEELPPGSTLIFYRYCDHENAAYKKTFLIFTVLLGEAKEIPAESRLSAVEEMVDDHLQNKFLSRDHPVSFDRMDLDKYGGLWSRISHLILPVTAEERIGHEGCEYNRT